ncbi:MAG: potassium channel family protein [Eggerthellaceae bacterium]|nr:potassium channel family protein [Eggerthellaceae bacterium]
MRHRLYEMLEGDSAAATWYGRVMTVFIIASLVPLCFWGESPLFDAIEYVCVAVFVADYLARWSTADFKVHKGAASFAVYPFTPMAIIDLVTILPTFIALNPAWRTLRVLRLLRTMRAFRLVRYSRSVDAIASAVTCKRGQLGVVVALAVAYVLISAMVMFNIEHETFESFFSAVYWSTVSLTTVGYGDLYPTTDVGRAIAMLSSFVGIAIVALPASIITAGLMEGLEKKEGGDSGREGRYSGRVVQHEQGARNNTDEAEDIE